MNKDIEARGMALDALATPPREALFATPIDYLAADHDRQRVLCWTLDRIARSEAPDAEEIRAVLRFLAEDFAVHVTDEEEDLFPLLARRAEPEDRIGDVLAELSAEHAAEKPEALAVARGLEAALATGSLDDALRPVLTRFAAAERRHLIVENAIVLPLARARLTGDDLRTMTLRMTARRGVAVGGREVGGDRRAFSMPA